MLLYKPVGDSVNTSPTCFSTSFKPDQHLSSNFTSQEFIIRVRVRVHPRLTGSSFKCISSSLQESSTRRHKLNLCARERLNVRKPPTTDSNNIEKHRSPLDTAHYRAVAALPRRRRSEPGDRKQAWKQSLLPGSLHHR